MSRENSLFNETTIKRLVSDVKITAKHKKAVNKWLEYFKSGKLENEKQAYIEFANIILRDLLDYDISLEGLKHEEENIEFLFKKDGNNLICFEAKGAKTKDLWAYQGRDKKSRETPVNQINSYMYDKVIPFGILTNYGLFVLFDRNEGSKKYHLIDFTELTNEDKLKEFIALFSREQVEKGFIIEVIQQSIVEEREFTKEFYKLYHETRLMLIKEFEENSDISREASVHFAQLYLNRLMFVFFAEDTGKINKQIVEERILKTLDNVHLFSSNSSNISNVLVGLFKDLDKGSDFPIKVFGFNGGLFQHPIPPKIFFKDFRDDKFFKDFNKNSKLKKKELELNENEQVIFNKYKNKLSPIIKNVLLMASFDFNSEVNVNILGHIFEQSISDIEDLKTDKSSRRKKEGIFYTPGYITDYICRNTIITYLSKKGINSVPELIKEYAENIEELEEKFKAVKILDPACGSGAFLIKATDIMLEIFKAIQEFKQSEGEYEAKKGLKKKSNSEGQLVLEKWNEEAEAREIIENSIHGVDINEESVEITKLSLFLKMARKNRKLTDLSQNIKQGNSLIDDPEVAGKSAFDWNKEFPEIIGNGGFDVVIGNPPYVRADVDDENYKKQREWIVKKGNYKTLYEKWDLYLAFVEKGTNLLKENGKFGMIIPDAFCTAKYALKTREFLSQEKQVTQIDYYPDEDIFEGVGVKNIILFIENSKPTKNTKKIVHKELTKTDKILKIDLKKVGQKGFRLNYVEDKNSYENCEFLGDICFISKGMVLNADEKKYKGEFKKDDLISDKRDEKHPKRYVEAKNAQRYLIRKIRYLEWETNRVPKKVSRKTFPELYEGEKLMRGRMTEAVYDNSGVVTNDSIYVLKKFTDLSNVKNKSIEGSIKKNNNKLREELEKMSKDFNLKYILSILNSKWAFNFLKNVSMNRLSFYPDDLRKIPIPKLSEKEQKPFIEKADLMLKLNKEFYEKKGKFLKLIKHEYKIEKITRKLDEFYRLEFDDFMKQLKVNLNMEKKAELLDFFEKNKKEISKLRQEIDKTDREIDEIVYKLYGLSEEEIKIVEDSLRD